MQGTLSEPLTNGASDALADMEHFIRVGAMQMPLQPDPRFHAWLADCRGVIHVGAHTGQEREIYGDLPVVWIEALAHAFYVLEEQIKNRPHQHALNYLVADGKRYKFGVANNAGQSSSIFDFARHKELWPDVGHVAAVMMESVTLAWVINRHRIDLDVYDALVLDVQGAELLVLQGAGDYLTRFKWIQAEAADFEAYQGGCQLRDIDAHMTAHGFVREQLFPGNAREGVGQYFEALYRNARHAVAGLQREKSLAEQFSDDLSRAAAQKIECEFMDQEEAPLRLNLGAGATTLPGFTNVDRKLGTEVYPLPYPDSSVEEIVASHVLEHFGHREIRTVMRDWVRTLRPGGKIRLAVPDFEEVARLYLAGAPVNVQGYVMGGHSDADDHHGAIFDREALTEEMIDVGLERIGPWTDAAAQGCAAGPHSLNLQGFKPSGPELKVCGVRAVRSVPRYGPLMHPRCADKAFIVLGIPTADTSSCYWAQQISNLMEDALKDDACRYVLTMDFDTVFSAHDVLELYRLLEACPEVDAVFPLQSKRTSEEVLFSIAGKQPGTVRATINAADLRRNLLPAHTGHFGLTLFRADSLRRFPRPWMVPQPSADGLWRDGHTDADIDFWKRFKANGFTACLAPRVVVGHLEEIISWPGKDLKKVFQTGKDYEERGIPAEVER